MHASARPYAIAGLALLTSSVIAVTPAMSPAGLRVANMDVRLVDVATDVTSALGSIDPLSSLGGLSLPDLGSLDLGSLFADGSLLNIPYNLFADVVNIPYYESLALQEYAYALGPAGSAGGVPGWIPPGATGLSGSPADLYTLGGTGSWYRESIGNTWGWDDGNWPQAGRDFALPSAVPVHRFHRRRQAAELRAGRVHRRSPHRLRVRMRQPVGLSGRLAAWRHAAYIAAFPRSHLPHHSGQTPWTVRVPRTCFTCLISSSPPTSATWPPGCRRADVIWSGQPGAQLNLLEPLQAIAGNLTASPSADPIQFPDLGSVFSNALTLGEDIGNDFNPFVEGSFLWWGAPTDYSIPTAIGGTITDFTGIPNQCGFPADQTLGSEPLSTGYTSNPLDLPGGFAQGLQYFLDGNGGTAGNGLLGYLNPEIYL